MTARRASLAAMLALIACSDRPPKPWPGTETTAARDTVRVPAPTTSPASLLADSAAADSVAFASLPAGIREDLDVGPLLSRSALRDSARSWCQSLADADDPVERRRLRGRWPDTLAVVLFVRAHRASGVLGRVEMVRRTTDGQQRGYIWDADGNVTEAVEWIGGRSLTRRLPEGTPTPRALRALGRRLLVIPCAAGAQ